jgi:hypothetical protein
MKRRDLEIIEYIKHITVDYHLVSTTLTLQEKCVQCQQKSGRCKAKKMDPNKFLAPLASKH